ncbi:hypothetical protein P3X46_014597 [Hevea brasiliensis]|uniref:Uncharacterized protein n=3 Tax=Hevea brasiliensis TaxID=3981 RepID=A0A6A6M8F3_HEVBR|nr:hypothetical protein GH714_005791 [Hevea brasiliensis]KAF2315417.1 hypothetical protein GH714_039155 [Hevea brasiliensis]KAJ9171202.1 hypothetical protein P3X46_014597 [Hevea brasiliensis]
MDENGNGRHGIPGWSWWGLASCTQFVWGMSSYRKGYAGDSRLMPFKAFAVASLFVSSAASASVAALQASGIHKVEDLLEMGTKVRTGLGIPPTAREERVDDL